MDKNILIRLLRKSVLYRLFDNIDELISKANLTHRELSNRAGNSDNWFNDAYNNNEDIYISSFVKILSVVSQKYEISDSKLLEIFSVKILKITSLITRLSDEDETYINEFIVDEKALFLDILGDWASMASKNKLNNTEIEIMNRVRALIN